MIDFDDLKPHLLRCVVCEFLLADIFHKSNFYLLGILDNFLS
jgi:hypothetical protein